MRILGLDEAGRGPVLGPLVLAAVCASADAVNDLAALGVGDSKALSRTTRERLYPHIVAACEAEVVSLPAAELEANLNELELTHAARLIDRLRPDVAYLDAPVPPAAIPAFVSRLLGLLQRPCRIVAENRADARYPVVGAASIVAKVVRDRAMVVLQATHGDIGWGYPAEPKTLAFLQRCADAGHFPDCVRHKWATVRRLKAPSLFSD